MGQIAAIVRTLAIALWVGGMLALDIVEAPVRFASPLLNRNQAVGIGQELFARFNRVEVALAVVGLAAAIAARSARWTIGLVSLMLALVLVQAAYLTPAISRLAKGLDFVNRTPGDPRFAAIRPLHAAYAVLEVAVFLAGIAALAAWACPERQ